MTSGDKTPTTPINIPISSDTYQNQMSSTGEQTNNDSTNNDNNNSNSLNQGNGQQHQVPSLSSDTNPSMASTSAAASSAPSQQQQQQQEQQQQQSSSNNNSTQQPPLTPSTPPPPPDPIQSICNRLLSLRGSPPGTLADISELEIKEICNRVKPILLSQPMLLELEAPLKICGDVHGQYTDLLRLFEYGGFPPDSNYLFLGDYVDRGKQSLEVICILLCYKIQYPNNFFLLRGNHESAGINRIYGFYDECKRRYSIKLWKVFSDVFNCLPVSALVDEKILCMHGGLSPEISSLQQIADLNRPSDVPDVGLMCDLLWSDPDTAVSVSLSFLLFRKTTY